MSTQERTLSAQKTSSSFITTGFALFSMFFGAGNLIVPLLVGKAVGDQVWMAISGLALTAVLMPLLGLAAMVLFQGDTRSFFGRVGKIPGMGLLLLIQLILGPFGVIPRLVTLMHALAEPYLHIPLLPFSLAIAMLLFVCCLKTQRLIKLLGAVLTPILLVSLATLIILGLIDGSSMNPVSLSASESFMHGLVSGYSTMDLMSAFLFATVILPHFQNNLPAQSKKSVLKKMTYSSLVAIALLFATYVGLCLVSAHQGWKLDASLPSEKMLGAIAFQLLGPAGGCIAAVAVITACLTTAISLASIFAGYLQKDLCKGKISKNTALILTVLTTTIFANLGFGGIMAFLTPILQIVYPGLILLTLLNLCHALYGYRMVKAPMFLAFTGSAAIYFFSL